MVFKEFWGASAVTQTANQAIHRTQQVHWTAPCKVMHTWVERRFFFMTLWAKRLVVKATPHLTRPSAPRRSRRAQSRRNRGSTH